MHQKNGVTCVFIIFSPWIVVIKMSKMAHFCIFCWWQPKINHSLGKIFKCIWKIFLSPFRKCYRFLGCELPLARCKPLKIQDFGIFADTAVFLYFYPRHQRNGNSKSNSTFSKAVNPLSVRIQWIQKNFMINFFLSSAEKMKNEPYLTF